MARLAGVSPSTASLAFSGAGPVAEATRIRVLAAAQELHYAGPDPRGRSLRRGRSGIVGVITQQRLGDAFRDPIKIALLDGLAEEVADMDAGLLLLTPDGGAPNRIEEAPMDAVVLMGYDDRIATALTALRHRGVPAVAIEGIPSDGIVTIGQDNREATRTAARYLFDQGHRRVAVVALPFASDRARGFYDTEPARPVGTTTAIDRLAGARDVFPDALVWWTRGSQVEEGRLAARALLASTTDRPTAIIAQSDLLAAGVIRAAEDAGLAVPQDLSVVGFDGVRVDGLWPYDLTTLVQPATEKGRAAGRALLTLLHGDVAESVTFSSVFRQGNTAAVAPDVS